MTEPELVAVEVKSATGRRAVYRVTPADRLLALRLYRAQALEARTGLRPVEAAEAAARRRLARGHARLYLAVRHAGIPPTPDADPSRVALDGVDPAS